MNNIRDKAINEKIAEVIDEFYDNKEIYVDIVDYLKDMKYYGHKDVDVLTSNAMIDEKFIDIYEKYRYNVNIKYPAAIIYSNSLLYKEPFPKNISFEQSIYVMEDCNKLKCYFDMYIFYNEDMENPIVKETGKLGDDRREYSVIDLGDNWYYFTLVWLPH